VVRAPADSVDTSRPCGWRRPDPGIGSGSAPGTRTSRGPVDRPLVSAGLNRAPHCRRSLGEDASELLVADRGKWTPRRDTCPPERLRLPDVPDPGDETLVEQRFADLPPAARTPQPGDHPLEVRGIGEDVRPEAPDAARIQLEHGSAPEHRLPRSAAQDEPWTTANRRAPLPDRPATPHPQVAPQDETAFEVKDEVLPDRLDAFESPAVELLGHTCRSGARMGRVDGDRLADEDLQPLSGEVESITLRHRFSLCPVDHHSSIALGCLRAELGA